MTQSGHWRRQSRVTAFMECRSGSLRLDAIWEVNPPNLLCPSWNTFVRHEFESHNKSNVRFGSNMVAGQTGRPEVVRLESGVPCSEPWVRQCDIPLREGSVRGFLAAKPPGMLPNCDNPAREQQRANDPHQ